MKKINKLWHTTTITRRITLILVSFTFGIIGITAGATYATAASIKNISIVTTDTIRLKDVFDGVTQNADYVIGAAPMPGQDMVLNARTLYRIAVALDLPWRPKTSAEQVIIRREATIVPYSAIETTLKKELESKGLNGRYDITFNNGEPSFILPQHLASTVEISSMDFDPARDSFQAVLVAPSKNSPEKTLSVSGTISRLIEVPVLRSPLRNGIIIGENDLDWIDMPQSDLQPATLIKAEDLIGMTPRRFANAGKPIDADELESPQIVVRGETVTIFFKEGPLQLSTKGKALQSGAKGDLVRVTNINTSKSIDGMVTAENEITVQ